MERLILNDLLKWRNSKHRKPLILKGVRQVGKTWIPKELGSIPHLIANQKNMRGRFHLPIPSWSGVLTFHCLTKKI